MRSARPPRTLLVRHERRAEPRHIRRQAALRSQLLCQLGREAIGIVEPEDQLARHNRRAAGLASRDRLLELGLAAPQRAPKARLLLVQRRADRIALLLQLGVSVRERRDGELGQARQKLPIDADRAPVAHRPADQPACHIGLVDIAGTDALDQDEHRRTGVVGDHPQCEGLWVSRERLDRRDDWQEQLGLVGRWHALQQRQRALEPQAEVDVALREAQVAAVAL
jgi:hypothetical protein